MKDGSQVFGPGSKTDICPGSPLPSKEANLLSYSRGLKTNKRNNMMFTVSKDVSFFFHDGGVTLCSLVKKEKGRHSLKSAC